MVWGGLPPAVWRWDAPGLTLPLAKSCGIKYFSGMPDRKQVTISIDEAMHRAMRDRLRSLGMTFSGFIETQVASFLAMTDPLQELMDLPSDVSPAPAQVKAAVRAFSGTTFRTAHDGMGELMETLLGIKDTGEQIAAQHEAETKYKNAKKP